ncbi:unnamed protein product [Gongylonema pulchrum]|uniref:Transposase n=1 Tax=Gongylonema pulchrum TaxID=637853 RepID=A0A183D8X7_9BILA|nr:unnamed protein product [Gongylonema pulchrum]
MNSVTWAPKYRCDQRLAVKDTLVVVPSVWFQNRRSKERRLKHLCNYLRRFEQRGLIPPPIGLENAG